MYTVRSNTKENVGSLFWEEYKRLHRTAITPSPFYSYEFLQILFDEYESSQIISVYDENNNMIGAFCLRKVDKHKAVFLNDGHSDHNPFIIANSLSIQEQQRVINSIVSALPSKYALSLTNIPDWNCHLKWFLTLLRQDNWHVIKTDGWDCPTVVYKKSASVNLEDYFNKLFNKSRLNNYHNRLRKLPAYEYEILNNTEFELWEWICEYCNNHEERWNVTETPSQYIWPNQRELILRKARAWHSAGQLVRFAIKVNQRRIVTVLCYKQGSVRLIYGLPSYSTEYSNYHPGAVLLSCIGKWAGQNGYREVDFGVGSEEYKYRYVHDDQKLFRVYASKTLVDFVLLKGWLEKTIRERRLLIDLWNKWVNQGYRKVINRQLINLQRIRHSICLLSSDPIFHIKRILKTRISSNVVYYKCNRDVKLNQKYTCYNIVSPDLSLILQFTNDNPGFTPTSRAKYIRRYHIGEIPYAIIDNEKIVQLSWVSAEIEDTVKERANGTDDKKIFKIYDCYTAINHRGKGYYAAVLSFIINKYIDEAALIIYTDEWNIPPQKGISKAGFIRFGIRKGETDSWKAI